MATHRKQVKTLFLTYPRCRLPKERILEHLRTIDQVNEYVVAKELHEDGEPHLHAYVKFQTGLRTAEFTPRLDVDGHHGNYQSARSFRSVVKYVTKDGDYITNLSDVMLETPQAKRIKLVQQIEEKSIKELVRTGVISFQQARNATFVKNLLTDDEYEHDTVRGVWIVGPPATGKSTMARTNYGQEGVFTLPIRSKWFCKYTGQGCILLDDFDSTWPKEWSNMLKILADKFPCTGETKGGTVQLRHKHLVVTSNYTIDQIYAFSDQALLEALTRRFTIITTTRRDI